MEIPADVVADFAPRVVQGTVLDLVEGITTPRPEKQPGGKTNRRRVKAHILEINFSAIAITHPSVTVPQLRVKPFLMAYDRTTKRKRVIESMDPASIRCSDQQSFTELLVDPPPEPQRFRVEFRSLIVRHTSHNNGGKLFFRFVLFCAGSSTIIDHVDSQDFQTITQRGLEKRRDRELPVLESPESESFSLGMSQNTAPYSDAFIEAIEPTAGVMSGHQFVKLIGHDLPQRMSGVSVRFGNQECNEIFVVKRNFILCETPAVDEPGPLDVRVSFDAGQTFITSFASYQFVDPTTSEGRRTLIAEGFRGTPGPAVLPAATGSATTSEVGTPTQFFAVAPPEDISSWLLG